MAYRRIVFLFADTTLRGLGDGVARTQRNALSTNARHCGYSVQASSFYTTSRSLRAAF